MDNWCLAGCSGSGKSKLSVVLSRHVKNKKRRFVVSKKSYPSATPIELDDDIFDRFSTQFNSTLVLDDLNKPTDKEIKIIRRLLVETSRHKNLRVIIIVHSILKNRISEFLPHFTQFLIGSHPNNRLIFEQLISALKLEDKTAARTAWSNFRATQGKDKFLYLDESQQFSLFEEMEKKKNSQTKAEKADSSAEERRERITRLTTEIVSVLDEDPKSKIALMNHLFQTLPFDLVCDDLSMHIKSSRGRRMSASLPDILYFITTGKDVRVPDNVYMVIKCIFENVSVPRLFVQNRNLKDLIK